MALFRAKFAAGETASKPLTLGGDRVSGFSVPPGFTGASLSFMASTDGWQYYPVHSITGDVVSISVTAGVITGLYADLHHLFRAIKFLQVVANTAQSADVEIGVITYGAFDS